VFPRDWRAAWRNALKRAGLKLRFHDLRHTAITNLRESGAPEQAIMAIAGHLSRRMLEHYSHIRLDAKRKALDSIVTKTVTKSEGKTGKVSNLLKTLAGTTGLEPATSCVTGSLGWGISLILRHAWQRKSTQNHGKNAQMVLIWYSFFRSSFVPRIARSQTNYQIKLRPRSVTKLWRQLCKYMRGWLQGLVLNHRLLGYEPNLSMARLCLSMIYVEVVLRCSTLFWGILFSTCSSSCSRNLAQRLRDTEVPVVRLHCSLRGSGRYVFLSWPKAPRRPKTYSSNFRIASTLCASQSRMKSHFSFSGSHIQKLRSSVSSAPESMSDTIKSSVPHPGQHLFFLRAKSHLQCGQW
jgi:hypothetical protein